MTVQPCNGNVQLSVDLGSQFAIEVLSSQKSSHERTYAIDLVIQETGEIRRKYVDNFSGDTHQEKEARCLLAVTRLMIKLMKDPEPSQYHMPFPRG